MGTSMDNGSKIEPGTAQSSESHEYEGVIGAVATWKSDIAQYWLMGWGPWGQEDDANL